MREGISSPEKRLSIHKQVLFVGMQQKKKTSIKFLRIFLKNKAKNIIAVK